MKIKKVQNRKHRFLKILLIVIAVVFGLITACHTTITIKAFTNYKYNVEVWNEYNYDGIINDQWDFEKLKYGFGNIGANGCGAVSVYNILKMENKNPNLPEIIKQFDLCGENIFGIGGSKPSRVIRILRKNGLKVTYTLNKNKFEELAQNGKYSIYLYFGSQSGRIFGHYQLLYNFDGEKFNTINVTGEYTFNEIVDIPGVFFSMMISVN